MENMVMEQQSHVNGSNNYVSLVEEQPSMEVEVEDPVALDMGVLKLEEIAEAVASAAAPTCGILQGVPPPL